MKKVSDALLKQILAGLEGVTSGPWSYEGPVFERHSAFFTVYGPEGTEGDQYGIAEVFDHVNGQVDPNARHIARCDPDTIRSIVTELLAARKALR